jgi:CBS domain-containing protein
MDVSDIADRTCPTVDPETRVGTLRSTFEGERDGVIVTENGDPTGVVTPREFVRSHVDDDATARTVSRPVPTVDRTTDVREVARLLVENRTPLVPVTQGSDLRGSVTRDGLLAAVVDDLDVLAVEDLHTPEVVAIGEDDTLGEALNRLREEGVSRLPVVEDDGRLAGIVTATDVMGFVVRDDHAPSAGSRDSGDQRLLDLPVSDAMSRPAATTTPDSSVADAVAEMLEQGYDGLVVSHADDDLPAGVLTKTDVLRALTYTETDRLDVQITNVDLLQSTTRERVAERIESIAGKYAEMTVEHVHLRLQRHEEERRGRPLVRCSARMWTNEEQAAGTGEAYGGDDAVSLALDTLERNVLEMKGRRTDGEARENHAVGRRDR